MNLYINGLGCISPQKTCGEDTFRENAVMPADGVFVCAEPSYREYIDPKVSRRMSRIIKMGIASAKMALADGGVSDPASTGAIITGTGLGCVADTSQFLDDVISTNEGMCSPTAFIQSTHNTISSQIAIHFACHGYNSTYSHRAHSFESALMDAGMRLSDNAVDTALVGGVDEMTPRLSEIARGLGLSRSAEENISKGFIPGEGAVFALLSLRPQGRTYARLAALRFGSNLTSQEQCSLCEEALRDAGISREAVDCVVDGRNGDVTFDAAYDSVCNGFFRDSLRVSYKKYCGEYFTAPAFSLWLAAKALSEGALPHHADPSGKKLRNAVVLNIAGDKYFSIMVLSNEQTD